MHELREKPSRGVENIGRELAPVRALLDDEKFGRVAKPHPHFGKLPGEESSEERADAHIGEIIAVASDVRASGSVIAVQRMVERQSHGEPVDLSRVELDDPQSKEKIVLVKDLPTRSTKSYAVLISPDRQTSVSVKQGATFVWPSEPNVTYKVIDLRPEQAVIQQVDTKKMFTIPAQ